MGDEKKTKDQLIDELQDKHRYISDLEQIKSEWRLMKKSLENSKIRLDEVQKIAHLGHWELDIFNNKLTWSDEIYRIFNLKPQEFGATYEAFIKNIHPEDRDMVNEAYTNSFKDRKPYQIEHRLLLSTGEIKYVLERCDTEYDNEGKPIRSIGTVLDITRQKKIQLELKKQNDEFSLLNEKYKTANRELINAKESIKESETNFRNLSNLTFEGILIHNNGIASDLNLSFLKMFGYKKEELLGKNLIKLLIPEKYHGIISKNISKEYAIPYEVEGIKKDGSLFPLEIEARTIFTEQNSFRVSAIRDITKRKQVEKKMSSLATVVEQASQVIIITDLFGKIEYANPAFEKTTGYSIAETIGQNPRILQGNRKDNRLYIDLWATIISGKTWHGVFYNKRKDDSHYYERAVIFPIKDSKGKTVNFAAVKQDITVEKKLQEQLLQSQKMEAIGTLAGGIAHDFNNILGVIMGYAELTIDEVLDNDDLMDNLTRIMKASERAKDMVEQILAFSRKSETTMVPVFIKNIIRETVKFLRASIPSTIIIKTNIGKDLGLILANGTQINQVLMNLCTNAAHAMKNEGGELEISLNNIEVTHEMSIGDLNSAKYQLLQVKDSGIGIKKDVIEKIFEPYFTTKKAGEGTGMGLAVAYGIIKSHHGYINVYSKPGEGTVFNVYLPLMNADDMERSERVEEKIIQGNGEQILFVDDESDLVELGIKILESLGYKVEGKNSSVEALEVFKTDPKKYDLIITDKTMPDMTGIKLSNNIHKIRPDIPVILCTGFIDGLEKNDYKSKGIKALIMKPINKRKIAEVVREVLDSLI